MALQELAAACLADCTQAQREAIAHVEGPLLVLAGPGSGKTRVITRRIAHLVAQGVSPDEIVAITFTNKAAGEMRERVAALGVPVSAWISTFHSFCARLLRMHGRHVGLEPGFSIYDTADSLSAVKRAMEEVGIAKGEMQPGAVARAISTAKNRAGAASAVAFEGLLQGREQITAIYERYQAILRAANAADFDDLLIRTVQLLRDTEATRDRLCRRFRFVLVDEYQDTNRSQYVIAKCLAGHGNLCVTGDPDQSIYGWRGADIRNILAFEKDFPQAKIVRLEQNYRSTKRILRAADRVIANNEARKAKGLWTENPEGDPVRLIQCEDDRLEGEAVAREITRLLKNGCGPRDIAVFYRLNAQSRTLESALRAEGIAYQIIAGTEFYQRREIKDLFAYLRLIDNPADDVSVERVANVPLRKLGETSLAHLKRAGAARGWPLAEALAHAEELGARGPALQGAKSFCALLAELRALPRKPVAAIVERLLKATKYEEYLTSSGDNAEDRIENVRELVSDAAEFDRAEPDGGLQGYIERAALISDVDALDDKKAGVTLMTLHAAKGLEFPAVIIVGLEDGLLPLMREGDGDHDLEEERRLFFVGLTRAKKRVLLTCADVRMRYGKTEYTKPSRFIKELAGEIVREGALPSPARFDAGRGGFNRPQPAAKLWGAPEPRRVRRSESEEVVYDGDHSPSMDDVIPSAPFRAGDRVEHPEYGRGQVLGVSGYGPNLQAKVQFARVGVKSLILQYARLKKVR